MRKNSTLTMESSVVTLSVKCYDEQLPNGLDSIKNIDSQIWQVIAICHDKDTNNDDIWLPATEKAHYHIIARKLDNKKPVKVRTVLNLLGVKYRQGLDDNLWKNNGVESVHRFDNMACYLTHDTVEAREDGKYQYDLEELVSNLTIEQIKNVRAGYLSGIGTRTKVGIDRQYELDDMAYKLGRELGDFDSWWQSLDYNERAISTKKVIYDRYQYGLECAVNDKIEVNRLCIFIQGEKNSGKSFACKDLPLSYVVNGGGSGKFDRLKASHKTLVINDYATENVLNMTDNYVCQVYKRGSHNPFWCGDLLVVTSNYDFATWLKLCHCDTDNEAVMQAYFSRFYICRIDNGKLLCTSASKRGTYESQLERKERFLSVRNTIQSSLDTYSRLKEDSRVVDYYDIVTDFLADSNGSDNPFKGV